MKFRSLILALLVNLLSVQSSKAVLPASDLAGTFVGNYASTAPIRVILVGDSTMSPRSGYGDALCQRLNASVSCINLARGGRSSGSFRTEGLWTNVQNLLRAGGNYSATYVLIQFGHNDQPGKPGRSTDLLTEFPMNMAAYAREVRELGGIAVLVTPLTRRTFHAGVLENNLKPWADAIKKVAAEQRTSLLDLNAESYAAVQAMGQVEADTLAMAPPPDNMYEPSPNDVVQVERAGAAKTDFDRTHLGLKGAAFFAAMVEEKLKKMIPSFGFFADFPAATETRPQLTPQQAKLFDYREVLRTTGKAGQEQLDPWDPLEDVLAKNQKLPVDYVVDLAAKPNGSTVFNSVQAAINRAVIDSRNLIAQSRLPKQEQQAKPKHRLYILLKPGVYRELLYVPATQIPITLYSNDGNAANTKISASLHAALLGSAYVQRFGAQFAGLDAAVQAMFASLKDRPVVGTSGSAIAWIKSDGFQAKNITFENSYNKDKVEPSAECPNSSCGATAGSAPPVIVHHQAVALMLDGPDKVQFENVRVLGFQDTLYLKSPEIATTVRSFFNKSYIEGNVDFIFGDSTAYFYQTEIKSLGDRTTSYVTAPNTNHKTKFGFVFSHCNFTHDGSANALAGKFYLGRQWFHAQKCTPYGKVNVPGYSCTLGDADGYAAPHGTISRRVLETVGKSVILHSRIGAHINRVRPWSDWNKHGALPYRPAQYSSDEYWRNLLNVNIDPPSQLGYSSKPAPADVYLAEFENLNE